MPSPHLFVFNDTISAIRNSNAIRMTGNALFDLLILSVPLVLARLWWTGSKARELAVAHAHHACRQRQLQFLDQTVALAGVNLTRSSGGTHCLQRRYSFEFTDQGTFRDQAWLTMRGHTLAEVYFPYTRDADGNRIYAH